MKDLNTNTIYQLDMGYDDKMVEDLKKVTIYRTVEAVKRQVDSQPGFIATTNDVFVTLTSEGVKYCTEQEIKLKPISFKKLCSLLSDERIVELLEGLHEDMDREMQMDGSGELGGRIMESYKPQLGVLETEIEKRSIDLYSHEEEPCESDELPY